MAMIVSPDTTYTQLKNLPQQDDEVLDLCTKKIRISTPPTPPTLYTPISSTFNYIASPTCQYSPVSNSDSDTYEISTPSNKSKAPRPFKAYPSDPLNVALGAVSLEIPLTQDSSEAFSEFRKRVLSRIQTNNGTNKNMRRTTNNEQQKVDDPTYWEKRRKNNEAAKRSRDARRAKEDEIAIRCFYLEQENIQLKIKLTALENEKKRLHDLIYHHYKS